MVKQIHARRSAWECCEDGKKKGRKNRAKRSNENRSFLSDTNAKPREERERWSSLERERRALFLSPPSSTMISIS